MHEVTSPDNSHCKYLKNKNSFLTYLIKAIILTIVIDS